MNAIHHTRPVRKTAATSSSRTMRIRSTYPRRPWLTLVPVCMQQAVPQFMIAAEHERGAREQPGAPEHHQRAKGLPAQRHRRVAELLVERQHADKDADHGL